LLKKAKNQVLKHFMYTEWLQFAHYHPSACCKTAICTAAHQAGRKTGQIGLSGSQARLAYCGIIRHA